MSRPRPQYKKRVSWPRTGTVLPKLQSGLTKPSFICGVRGFDRPGSRMRIEDALRPRLNGRWLTIVEVNAVASYYREGGYAEKWNPQSRHQFVVEPRSPHQHAGHRGPRFPLLAANRDCRYISRRR